MQMIGDSRAGRAAQIHAQIEAVGMISVIERRLHALRKQHHFRRSFPFEAGKIRGMRVGNDHDVARSIGIAIQNDEIFHAAKDDEPFFIVRFAAGALQKTQPATFLASAM